jgi:hypothetical protein
MKKELLPDWAKKYNRKGVVFRKKGDVFVMVEVHSHRVPGKKYPVVEQIYLGTVSPDGFSPKGSSASSSDTLMECGLSHFILANFHRELTRSIFNSGDKDMTEGRIRAAIVLYLYGAITDITIGLTAASIGYQDAIAKVASSRTIRSICKKIDDLIMKSFPDDERRISVTSMLRQCMADRRNPVFSGYPDDVKMLLGDYR